MYLFNPFGVVVLRAVLALLFECSGTRPRPLRIAYVNCAHDHVLQESGWLTCYERWPATRFAAMRRPISFWSDV